MINRHHFYWAFQTNFGPSYFVRTLINYNFGYPGRCAGLGKEAAELQTNAAGILFGVTSAHSESIQRE